MTTIFISNFVILLRIRIIRISKIVYFRAETIVFIIKKIIYERFSFIFYNRIIGDIAK